MTVSTDFTDVSLVIERTIEDFSDVTLVIGTYWDHWGVDMEVDKMVDNDIEVDKVADMKIPNEDW